MLLLWNLVLTLRNTTKKEFKPKYFSRTLEEVLSPCNKHRHPACPEICGEGSEAKPACGRQGSLPPLSASSACLR